MAIYTVLPVTLTLVIIDTTLAVNVTMSLSAQTWHESQGLCDVISYNSVFSDEPFHWSPRLPMSPSQVWIDRELPHSIAWIHFAGCFNGSLVLSTAVDLRMNGDVILECSRKCSDRHVHIFYVMSHFCICEGNDTNNISLTSLECSGSPCPGKKGGFCGDFTAPPRACLCKYENVSVHVPPTTRSPETCGNTIHVDCEKCVNDGRWICTPGGQTPKFRTDKHPQGFTCNGRQLSLHAEVPLRNLKGQSVHYLYGIQTGTTHSDDTQFCLAWNTRTNILTSKPCDCSVKALCIYNGSLIGRTGHITENGLSLGVGVTVGFVIAIIIIVCVLVWKFRLNKIPMKVCNCMSDPEPTSEATLQTRHSGNNINMYDNSEWGTVARDRNEGSSDDQERHYDSTQGGEIGEEYDYLGQNESQQRTEQRLVSDYDTMAAVRAEFGMEVTNT